MDEKKFRRILFEASVLGFLNGIGDGSKPSEEDLDILCEKYHGNADEFMGDYRYVLSPNKDKSFKTFAYILNNDISKVRVDDIVKEYSGIEHKTLRKVMQDLDDFGCFTLWNDFLDESAKYGDDNYAFDLQDTTDIVILTENGTIENNQALKEMIDIYGRMVYFPNGKVKTFKGKEMIATYWGDIFERVLLYPFAYTDSAKYSLTDDVFIPCMAEMLGYEIDEKNCEVRVKI